ncbi:MAG TPA: class I SAM-dependent methyltransferase [Pirellulales bacterium]|nr:class I SAM-dependent methyltransferase [Pirellulales bacterium]
MPDHEPARGGTSPVIAGGRLYLRSNTRLHCYDVRLDRPPDVAPAYSVELPKLRHDAEREPAAGADREPRVPNGVYLPTPHDVVKRMLELAEVAKTDVVYDLGCGDGRTVIAAAKQYGCRALGYDIDAELVAIARQEAKKQGVEKLVTIERGDLFGVDLAKADVVTLYLLPEQNEKLVAQLKNMRPGSRIVAHQFPVHGLVPASSVEVKSEETGEQHTLYLYRGRTKSGP